MERRRFERRRIERRRAERFGQVYDFHGHICLMSTAGVRVAISAMAAIGMEESSFERLVACYHAKTCALDSIQYITGCTLGNNNFFMKDEKKHVLELVRENDGKGVRVSLNEDMLKKMKHCMDLKKEYENETDKAQKLEAKRVFKAEFKELVEFLQEGEEKAIVDISSYNRDGSF